jgi:RNA recognition motif-containing protein
LLIASSTDDCQTESESSSNGRDSSNNQRNEGSEISDTLFIGDLSKDVSEKDLIDAFSVFGEVAEAVIKRSRTTRVSLGYGFVTMKSPELAQLCAQQEKELTIKGKKIRIGKAQRNSTLFISQLSADVKLSALLDLFRSYGDVITEECLLIPCGERPLLSSLDLTFPLSRQEAAHRCGEILES